MPLPTFLVIGAYKCGTTSLHHYLAQHPQVFVPRVKEPNFFAFEGLDDPRVPAARHRVRTLDDYLRLFDDVAGQPAVGEVSPEYMVSERACDRIRDRLPDVRLVAILRDPVARAYSDYLMYVREGLEPCDDFAAALDQQEARRRRHEPTGYYVTTGFYGAQLERYFAAFPHDHIHVMLLDDLQRDPRRELSGLFAFLGVDPSFVPPRLHHHNVSGVPDRAVVRAALRARRLVAPLARPLVPDRVKQGADRLLQRQLRRPTLNPSDRARLVETYRADVVRLEALIGRDLSEWRAA